MDHENVKRSRKRRGEGIIRTLELNQNRLSRSWSIANSPDRVCFFLYIICIVEDYLLKKKIAALMLTENLRQNE